MNILDEVIHQRERAKARQAEAEERFMQERAGVSAGERRKAWREWVLAELFRRFRWPEDAQERGRLMGQCASYMTVMARQCMGRGWLLDGRALARHTRACLMPVSLYMPDAAAPAFWPYFCKAVRTYAGTHAEELRRDAFADELACDQGGIKSIGELVAAMQGIKPARRRSLIEELCAKQISDPAPVRAAKQEDAAQEELPL